MYVTLQNIQRCVWMRNESGKGCINEGVKVYMGGIRSDVCKCVLRKVCG